MARRRNRTLVTTAVVAGAVAVGLLVASTVLLPRFRFPEPTGPYAIGTVTHHWIDADRPEILGPEPGQPRELMVQLWYPTERVAAEPSPYVADADVVVPALARTFNLPGVALRQVGRATTHAVDDAPVADGPEQFPVVLLMSGLGGFRQSTTFLAEELVSHGFVVVGIDLTYAAAAVAFPDGRVAEMGPIDEIRPLVGQSYLPATPAPELGGVPLEDGIIPYLGDDVSFVIDQLEQLQQAGTAPLAGRLDLDRIAVAGVSLGGLVAADAATDDPRIGAALIMDVAVPLRTVDIGLDVPTMWITRPPEAMRTERERAGGWPEEEIEAHHRTVRAAFDSLRAPGYLVQIPEISHLDFLDISRWTPLARWIGFTGPREGEYAHTVIKAYALGFLQGHLDGRAVDLDELQAAYPEVTLEVHEAP